MQINTILKNNYFNSIDVWLDLYAAKHHDGNIQQFDNKIYSLQQELYSKNLMNSTELLTNVMTEKENNFI